MHTRSLLLRFSDLADGCQGKVVFITLMHRWLSIVILHFVFECSLKLGIHCACILDTFFYLCFYQLHRPMESVKAESEKLPETSEEVRQQEKRGSAPSSMLFVKEELNGGAHFSICISTDFFFFFNYLF